MPPHPPESPLRARLRQRAATLALIRSFFAARDVLEVDTPALSGAAVTDPALASMALDVASLAGRHYLQTSPEFAMKRLLAAGSGDCYQIARVFRDDELGRWHAPEFLLLEWYRTGFDANALMDEVFALLTELLADRFPSLGRQRTSYRDAFVDSTGVDPHAFDAPGRDRLCEVLGSSAVDVPAGLGDDALLDLALTAIVVPAFPQDTAVFLFDYPPSQAALAAIRATTPPVAARFEVFVNGLELGNGFEELTDAAEQRRRFEADLAARRAAGQHEPPIDEDFLAALEQGMPDSAGVAIGIDRVIALATGAASLADVVPLPHGVRHGVRHGV